MAAGRKTEPNPDGLWEGLGSRFVLTMWLKSSESVRRWLKQFGDVLHFVVRRVAGVLAFVGVLCSPIHAESSSIIVNRPPGMPGLTASCPVFVMWPMTGPASLGGNVGVDSQDLLPIVANRILAVVRERCPNGELVPPSTLVSFSPIPGYPAVIEGIEVSADEQRAAATARERGATFLLVPTILQWKQVRTDDPIGALLSPHNQVSLSVTLMRLEHPVAAGKVLFRNHSRITLNQSAVRLLDKEFRSALRGLLWGQPAP